MKTSEEIEVVWSGSEQSLAVMTDLQAFILLRTRK